MKDHADRLQAAKDLADARNKIAFANAQFARARALANYNRTLTIARDDPAAAVIAYSKEIGDLGNGVGTAADLAFAYYARGAAYAKQHETDRARADFEHALRLKPDYADAAAARRDIVANAGAPHVAQAPHPARVAAAATPLVQGSVDGGNAAACGRALNLQQRAAQAAISRIASYDASIAGLAENARCGDDAKHVVNEAYLRSTLAAAEHDLNVRDWRAELRRADDLLAQCETMPALRGTSVAADCVAQRKFNEGAAAQWTPLTASPSPAPARR
jgi:tetratricopeptide (TPR) repeat protein